jgi:predicted nucleic acid-binding protein
MAAAPRYPVDTNILLRISRQSGSQHRLIGEALKELVKRACQLCYALQNIAEFCNVCTRPLEHNGYGLSISEASQWVEYIERTMIHLPDSDRVYSIWRHLVVSQGVRGVRVHDARLAAIMQAHGATHILTLNQPDFLRYSDLKAVHPSQVAELPK